MLDETRVPLAVRHPRDLRVIANGRTCLIVDGAEYRVDYEPAESTSGLFGGNSNWRGPIWFPINYLLIESLQKFHHYYGDAFKVECPTGSGQMMTLWRGRRETLAPAVAHLPGRRRRAPPVFGAVERFQTRSALARSRSAFHEYFHGDTGAGVGASHQTGWTALVAKLLQQTENVRPRSLRYKRKGRRFRRPSPL